MLLPTTCSAMVVVYLLSVFTCYDSKEKKIHRTERNKRRGIFFFAFAFFRAMIVSHHRNIFFYSPFRRLHLMSTTRQRYLEWKTRCSLPHIPIEIWAHLFSYLKLPDLLSLRLVSRTFYACINQHTPFWSFVVFNIDQGSHAIVPVQFLRNISTANLDLLSKTNRYAHCQIYLKGQPLKNSQTKRRKRRLLTLYEDDDEQQDQNYLRCLAVHFESLRSYDQFQLEHLLKKSVRRLEFSYECLSTEPSLQFLLKLDRLKYLKIAFLHNIFELDPFAIMLINTIQNILLLLLKLRRYHFESQKTNDRNMNENETNL